MGRQSLRFFRPRGLSSTPLGIQYERDMPRKIRELLRDLEKAGFKNRGGKGSHRNFEHACGSRITISGRPGDDVKPYQEREVKRKIDEVN